MNRLAFTAIVSCAIAIGILFSAIGISPAQEAAEYKPSWQAECGYKWRNSVERTQGGGRAAYTAFMRKPVSEGGCGAKASRNSNDERIREYLEQHKPQTECGIECGAPYQEARRGKK